MYPGIIFDVGGVLAIDVWEHLLLESVAIKYGLREKEVEKIGRKLWKKYELISGGTAGLEEEYWNNFKNHFRQLSSVDIQDFIDMTDEFIQPICETEMFDLLKRLKDLGVSIGICSNNTEFWFHKQKKRLQLDKVFKPESITLSCHYGINKKSLELFFAAARAIGCQPGECLFIDDRVGNLGRAVQCGMTGILFPHENKVGAFYLCSLLKHFIPDL